MIDPKKQYRTRDGRDVRIYAVDGGGDWPVHGAYMKGDAWRIRSWTEKGYIYNQKYNQKTDTDLIEVKPRIKRKVWVNVYPGWEHAYSTKRDAEIGSGQNRIACVEIDIDVEEGHGL